MEVIPMKEEDDTMVEEYTDEEFQAEKEEIEASVKKKNKEITINDLPGIGPATAEKLTAVGFGTVMAIAVATPGEIVEACGISEAGARKIINAARDNLEMGFESGDQILKRRERVIKYSTGHKGFDSMMGGGFETGAITEIYAEFGGGKTQIGHILAVNVLAMEGEKDPVVVYVDTENTFRPERITQIAEGKGMNVDAVLKNIKVGRAYNSDHQMLLVDKIEEMITEQHLNVKLIVIDSLTAHFRAEFVGRGTLADRQQKINKHMHALLKLADNYNICVYVTNQVMAKPDQFFGDPTQAIGGHIVGHASTFRIYLRKGKKGSRVAKLVDSPNLPEAEVAFYITEKGLQDI